MNNILKYDQYTITNTVPDIELNEVVIAFNDGINWHAIPLKLSNIFPIIHTKFHDLKFNLTSTQSIIVCPYSCFAASFDGELIYDNDVVKTDKNNMISITDVDKNKIDLISGTIIGKDDDSKHNIKRFEINVMTFRDMVKLYTNIKFLLPTIKKLPKSITKLSNNVNTNDNFVIHPKTLVYIIEYKSSKDNGYKNSVLIGSDANYDDITGFNINKNGITKYMNVNDKKIRLRSGFIYPIFWFVAKKLFPDAIVVKL
jgi:hypothetical protein